jgi:hypothetical protein
VAIGTLSFAPGETTQTITVLVTGDTAKEGDETLSLRLSNPQGAVLSGGAATLSVTGTIEDDDVSAVSEDDDVSAISIAAASVLEGDAGTSALTFTVTLSTASAQAVTVDYATAAASAVAGVDYAVAIDYTSAGGTRHVELCARRDDTDHHRIGHWRHGRRGRRDFVAEAE